MQASNPAPAHIQLPWTYCGWCDCGGWCGEGGYPSNSSKPGGEYHVLYTVWHQPRNQRFSLVNCEGKDLCMRLLWPRQSRFCVTGRPKGWRPFAGLAPEPGDPSSNRQPPRWMFVQLFNASFSQSWLIYWRKSSFEIALLSISKIDLVYLFCSYHPYYSFVLCLYMCVYVL